MAEAMVYVNEYLQRLNKGISILYKSMVEDAKMTGLVLPKIKKMKTMKLIFKEQVHQFLLYNSSLLATWSWRKACSSGNYRDFGCLLGKKEIVRITKN